MLNEGGKLVAALALCCGLSTAGEAAPEERGSETRTWDGYEVERLAEGLATSVEEMERSPKGVAPREGDAERLAAIEGELARARHELRTLAALIRRGANREMTRGLYERIREREGRIAMIGRDLDYDPFPAGELSSAQQLLEELAAYFRGERSID